MKRLSVAIAALAAVALTLTGCTAASGPDPDAKPSLLFWVDTPRVPQAEAYQKLMADEIDITIEVIAQQDAQTKITLANRAKKGWPDIIFGTAADTAQFLDPSNGFAADLTDVVSQEIFDGFGEGNSDCLFDGTYYCLKNDLANTVLWYNTVIFDELGVTVPTTMDEFAETALKLQGTGYSAGAIGDQNYYASYLQSSECPLADITAPDVVRIAPGDPKCTRVAELVQPLLDAGVLDARSSFDAGFIQDVAKQNKVAMTLGPSWFGDFVIRPAESWGVPEGQIAAANMPAWGSGDDDRSGAFGGGVFTVSSHSDYPQAAADAAVWMTTSDVMAELETTPTFPAYGPANKLWEARIASDSYYASNPYPAMAAGANKISQVDRPVRFAFIAQIGTVLQAGINGGSSLEQALNDYAESLQNLAPASGYTVETK
jgi:ABC-type glycerol-3-phosphate transport system substrate-binding protein